MTTSRITENINQVLERGSRAVLATLVAGAQVGAKFLIEEHGNITGSLGDSGLDEAVVHQAITFLQSRDDAKTAVLPGRVDRRRWRLVRCHQRGRRRGQPR